MRKGSLALSFVWGGSIEEISSEESLFENLNNLTWGNGVILLKCDPSRKHSLEVVGLKCWGDLTKHLVFLAQSLPLGDPFGLVFAYYALWNNYRFLAGVLQVRGTWFKIKISRWLIDWY